MIIPQRGNHESVQNNPHGVYKYNSNYNEWIKVIDYHQNFLSTSHTATLDINNESIYVCNEQSELMEMDLNFVK